MMQINKLRSERNEGNNPIHNTSKNTEKHLTSEAKRHIQRKHSNKEEGNWGRYLKIEEALSHAHGSEDRILLKWLAYQKWSIDSMQCPLKYQHHSLQKQKTTILKLVRKHKGPQIAIATLNKKNSVVVISERDFRLYYRTTVTKTARYGHKTRLGSMAEKRELKNKPCSYNWFSLQVAKTKPNQQQQPHSKPHPRTLEKR